MTRNMVLEHVRQTERILNYAAMGTMAHVTSIQNGKQVFNEMKLLLKKPILTDLEKSRINEIADFFNKHGITDRDLEACL